MKVTWIVPQNKRCGISIYVDNYLKTLRTCLDLAVIGTDEWFSNKKRFISRLNDTDIVHIQYETSFFMRGRRDFYADMLREVKKPVVVSVHEVYSEFPDVFPRESIKGPGPLRALKYLIYDLKHPAHSAYRRHLKNNFGAGCILVHHDYHKTILAENGVPSSIIETFHHPVKVSKNAAEFSWSQGKTVHLGSTGFLNPQYDYDLLFTVLEELDIKWRFTWVGGTRLPEHEYILGNINKKISRNGWEDRFRITGWVSEEDQSKLLMEMDIYLALFKNRSSSGSLARAMGAYKPIIARSMSLTNELSPPGSPTMILVNDDRSEAIVNSLKQVLYDNPLRNELLRNLRKYVSGNEYRVMASKLNLIYRRILDS